MSVEQDFRAEFPRKHLERTRRAARVGITSETMDTSFIGKKAGSSRVVLERGPVSNFANAVLDRDPVYHDESVATAAGFKSIPVPPTFGFAWANWGTFPEMQPDNEGGTDATVLNEAIGELLSEGGLMLHGEQAFEYHRSITVGDVLFGETTIVDMYEKESKGRRMKFLISETKFSDEQTGEPVVTTRMNLICRL